jgi:hypothetical protein
VNSQVLSVSRGRNVRCKSNRYAISSSNRFGFVNSVPPFYLHMKRRDMRLCVVQIKAYIFSLSEKIQQPTFRKCDILLVLRLKTQVFCEVLLNLSKKCTIYINNICYFKHCYIFRCLDIILRESFIMNIKAILSILYMYIIRHSLRRMDKHRNM